MGAPGAGQLTKMVNRICTAWLVQALSEVCISPMLNRELVSDVISKGAAQSCADGAPFAKKPVPTFSQRALIRRGGRGNQAPAASAHPQSRFKNLVGMPRVKVIE